MFGSKERKAAEQASAQSRFEYLVGLTVSARAAELLPVFGPDGVRPSRGNPGITIVQVLMWLMRDEPRGVGYGAQLQEPLLEAIQWLVTRGLVVNGGRGTTDSTYWTATSAGRAAIAAGAIALSAS
jgi:hypothetical protein